MKYALANPIKRIKREIVAPQFKITKQIIGNLYSFKNILIGRNHKKYNKGVFVWDVRSNSVTFDFAYYILQIVNQFNQIGYKSFDLILFCSPRLLAKGASCDWNEYNKFVSNEEILSKIEKIILKLANLFEYIDDIKLINTKQELLNLTKDSFILPKNYDPTFFYPEGLNYKYLFSKLMDEEEIKVPFLKLNPKCFKKEYTELYKSKYITLTLRDYGFEPMRNTKQTDIDIALKLSKRHSAELVIIPDNIDLIEQYEIPDSVQVIKSAREDLLLRIGIYSKSIVNIFTTSGPSILPLFIKRSKMIVLRVACGCDGDNVNLYKKTLGISPGDQPLLRLGGYYLWNDLFNNIDENTLDFAFKKISDYSQEKNLKIGINEIN